MVSYVSDVIMLPIVSDVSEVCWRCSAFFSR